MEGDKSILFKRNIFKIFVVSFFPVTIFCGNLPHKNLYIFPEPMKSLTIKLNHIGSVDIKILANPTWLEHYINYQKIIELTVWIGDFWDEQ